MRAPTHFEKGSSRRFVTPFRLPFSLGLICLAVAAPAAMMGQSQKPVALPDLSRELRHWGVDDGLPIGRVDCMARTADGYFWVGGKQLLARFNGHQFERFDPGELLGVNHDFITRLCVSADGELWAGSTRGGFVVFRDGGFKVLSPGSSPGEISALVPHPDGGMVASYATREHSSAVFRITETQTRPLCPGKSVSDLRAISLVVSPDRRIWMVDVGGRLFEVAGESGKRITLDDEGLGHFFTLGDGSLATVGRKGIYVYEVGEWNQRTRFEQPLGDEIYLTDTCQDQRREHLARCSC